MNSYNKANVDRPYVIVIDIILLSPVTVNKVNKY